MGRVRPLHGQRGEALVVRRGDEKRVAPQCFKIQRGVAGQPVVRPGVQDGEIQPAAEQTALHLVGRFLADAHLDAGVLPVKRGQHARQMCRCQIVGDAHGHAPLRQRALLVDLRFKRRVDAQHLAGHAIIFLARVGQHQPAGGARKQPRAELLLEGHHTMAQRRLGDKQLLRGAGHALFVRDGLDVKQFSGGHGVSSCGGVQGEGVRSGASSAGSAKSAKKAPHRFR